jgi:hypothetical protein
MTSTQVKSTDSPLKGSENKVAPEPAKQVTPPQAKAPEKKKKVKDPEATKAQKKLLMYFLK